MSNIKSTVNLAKVVTGKVRLAYLNVWQPRSVNGGDAKYSACLIIPKTDVTTINNIKSAIEYAKAEGKGKWGGTVPLNCIMPLRDGDMERGNDPVFNNSYFINATSYEKPQIVDKNLIQIYERESVYSGCYGRVSINLYAFNSHGNQGVGCGLMNLQKLVDGEPLTTRSKAEDDFSIIDDDDFLN